LVAESQQHAYHAHVVIAAQGWIFGLQHGQVAFEKAVMRREDLRIALFPQLPGIIENGVKAGGPTGRIGQHF
jgi:hypothetical protein